MIDLEQNEQVLLQARRHWYFLLQRLLPMLPLVFIPIIVIVLLPVASAHLPNLYHTSAGSSAFIIFILFSFFLFLWISAFTMWTNYYLDVLVVTDRRVINIEQQALFKRETSSLELDKIQDVSVEIFGVLATFLSFGNLRIQTAGKVEEFIINGIKDPDAVKDFILEQHEKALAKLQTVRIEKD